MQIISKEWKKGFTEFFSWLVIIFTVILTIFLLIIFIAIIIIFLINFFSNSQKYGKDKSCRPIFDGRKLTQKGKGLLSSLG